MDDKDSFQQAAEEDWLSMSEIAQKYNDSVEDYSWPWFWLLLAESIWPDYNED